MTTSSSGACRIALHDAVFARDPHAVYEQLRRTYGPLAPVELAPGVPATLDQPAADC